MGHCNVSRQGWLLENVWQTLVGRTGDTLMTITRYLPFALCCGAFVAVMLGLGWVMAHYAMM
jgi:hypothetical protein